ncbi:MAG: hypothetical protein U0528_01945 [Anaerolineae bacterium]
MKQRLAGLALLLLLSGCSALDWLTTLTSSNIYIDQDGIAGVIFDPSATYISDVESISKQILDTTFDGYWMPDTADVLALESALPAYLDQQAAAGRDVEGVAAKLPDYKRQYIGFTAGGEKMLYANYFCDAFDGDRWKQEWLYVMDGGNCFFQVVYQIGSGEFRYLSINGYA